MAKLYPYTNPALDAGEYVLDTHQGLSGQGPGTIPAGLLSQAVNRVALTVDGPRLRLTDGDVLARSPARDEPLATPLRVASLVLRQDSLPWQRSAAPLGGGNPGPDDTWVYLLVLPEDELVGWVPPPGSGGASGQVARQEASGALQAAPTKAARAPFAAADTLRDPATEITPGRLVPATGKLGEVLDPGEVGQTGTAPSPHLAELHLGRPLSEIPQGIPSGVGAPADTCDQIEMTRGHLKAVLPTRQELKDLVHVRRLTESERAELQDEDGYVAFVLANRVLKAGQRHLAILVSFQDQDPWALTSAGSALDKIRLVALTHWRFRAGTLANDFQHLVQGLDLKHWGKDKAGAWVPSLGDWIPLDHRRRDGTPGKGAYRGPLVGIVDPSLPRQAPATGLGELPAPTVYLPGESGGMTDISEQAAFELGRLLALSDKGFLTHLQGYRRDWQQAAAWAVQGVMSPIATQAQAQAMKSGGGDWSALNALVGPIPGLARLVADPVTEVYAAEALEAQADPSGVAHLANEPSVPGMDLDTLIEAKGLASEGPKSTGGGSGGESSIFSTLTALEGEVASEETATERRAAPKPGAPGTKTTKEDR